MIVAPGSSGTLAHRGGVFSRRSPLAASSSLLPLLLAVAVGPLPLGAQAVLRGYVLDQTTEIPIVGAEVSLYLARGDRAVSTAVADSTGEFEFTGVREDTYVLSSQRLGYLAVRTPQLNIGEADPLTVVLWMSTEAIPLAPVEVVAGTFRPRPIDQINPADIEGVEVYRGPSTLPAAFGGTTGHYGVIALWTRRGPG